MKTISLKKVAVVAVASLGFGLMSVVPVNAAVGTAAAPFISNTSTIDIDGAGTTYSATALTSLSSAATGAATRTVGLVTNSVSAITVPALTDIVLKIGSTSGAYGTNDIHDLVINGQFISSDAGTVAATNTLSTWAAPRVSANTVYTAVVTTYQTGTTRSASTLTVSNTILITVTPLSGLSASLSTMLSRADNTATRPDTTTNAVVATGSATKATANRMAINVLMKDTDGAALAVTGSTLSAEITGPGYLFWANAGVAAGQCLVDPAYGAATGRSLSSLAIDDDTYVYVCADGTAGVSTVTLTLVNSTTGVRTVLGTKTITFYGAVTKIVATGVLTVARAAGTTATGSASANRTAGVTPSVIIKATDAAGNPVSGLSFTAVTSSAAVMSETIAQAEDIKSTANVDSSGGAGFYNIQTNGSPSSKSGDKATLTFRILNPADATGTTYLTSAVDFTIGGSVSTETIAFDKTSYAPGEAMVITRTAKDSAGNPVYDGAASPLVTFSKAVGGTAPAAGAYVKGVSASSTSAATASVFAPVVPGAFSVSMTGGDAAATVRTASSSVTDANAGIAASISALNAKIVALNALIAKIMKRLNIR